MSDREPCRDQSDLTPWEEGEDPNAKDTSLLAEDSLIGFVDHITTVLPIDELRSISQALFDTGLTQGWPLSEQPGFATAGIRFGNLNLEICTVDRRDNTLDDWLTFEPANLDCLADDLKQRDIKHDPFDAVVIHDHPIYTRVGIPALENGSTALQLCRTFYPTRTTGPVAPENSAGIKQVSSVNIGMNAVERAVFSQLLEPRDWQNPINFEQGPCLSVSEAAQLKIEGMTVSVEDPIQAVKTLVAAGLPRVDDQTVRLGSLTIEISNKIESISDRIDE